MGKLPACPVWYICTSRHRSMGVQILLCNAGGCVSQLLCQHLVLSHVPFQNVTSSFTGHCWALVTDAEMGLTEEVQDAMGTSPPIPTGSDGICCVTELWPPCHSGSCHSVRFVTFSPGKWLQRCWCCSQQLIIRYHL